MKIRKLSRVIETSNEPFRKSFYEAYLNLQHCELGMQYDPRKCLLQLVGMIYPYTSGDCIFKIDKLELTHCID